ncbi:MAG: DUF2341 domain-containing protein [Pyrinomonadaceae bacterium]
MLANVVQNGRDLGVWDNIHQTNKVHVSHPMEESWLFWAGCPECVHTHWRWPSYLSTRAIGFGYGTGVPMIGKYPSLFDQTNQDVQIGVVRYKPGEEDPGDFKSLIVNPTENLINAVTRTTGSRRRTQVIQPLDVLYWYSGTSYEPESDLFFKHGSFFSPEVQHEMQMENAFAELPATQNGIRLITYGHVYEEGATNFSNTDPATLPPLPAGYVALDNRVYQISTNAIVSGPHVVGFDVPTVTDQTSFNNLAIFHLEHDPFDPDNMIWVDATILSPDNPAPNFATKLINARVNDVGLFAVGALIQPQPDPGSSDLSITSSHVPNSIVVENSVSYSLRVTNSGPQPSSAVGVVDILPPETTFVSVTSSQGTCKHKEGRVYCKLGTIPNGGIVDITIVANTFEDKGGIPSQGKSIANTAIVAGDNDDLNFDNNSATDEVSLLPHPNARPSVIINSPMPGAAYAPSSAVTITATANDADGTVSKVDFYDGTMLLGTQTGAGPQYQLTFSPAAGSHSLVAVATDNGGRTNVSHAVAIFVNGYGNIVINSPANDALFAPGGNITVTATATGSVATVEFFANSIRLGQGVGSGSHSVTWANVPPGNYTLTAVVSDPAGAITNSAPVNISVNTKPTVTITSPVDGGSYAPLSKVAIVATASDSDGVVKEVDFYANGIFIGAGSFMGQDRFSFDWIDAPTGIYSLTAVAKDNLGVTAASPPINIGVNTASPRPGEFIWFDDALPAGSVAHAVGDVDWHWVDANPAAFSGTKAHQSRSFGQLEPPNSFHEHSFESATATFPIIAGDTLFTYVFIDPNDMPREIMLQWKDASGWEHRAYWGENRINQGLNGTNSRRRGGELPPAGRWFPLGIRASHVGLEGSTLTGMKFSVDGGRATFDLTGKWAANAVPPLGTPPDDFIWIDDGLPPGAVQAVIDDEWRWVPGPTSSGQSAHQSYFRSNDNKRFRSHSFTGAQTPMQVKPGDVLFTYVYLGDPDLNHQPYTPDQIMLQWYDGTSWNHRAYWGTNYIDKKVPNMGVLGTEGQRYMGGLPAARGWYRLEVPASYVGLEGRSVSGMAFTVYRENANPFVTWDRSGKNAQPSVVPMPLSATVAVSKFNSQARGYAFETNELPPPEHSLQRRDVFLVHPNQAAGTVPMYRFRRPTTFEYFYARNREVYDGNGWQFEGIAFFVYPEPSTPGTVPLYLYHDTQWHYVLTTDYAEATSFGMDYFDGTWAYVYSEAVPVAPTPMPGWDVNCEINWRDNSGNETGFKVYRWDHTTFTYQQEAVLQANATQYVPQCGGDLFLIRAYNSGGISSPARACTYCMVMDDPPMEETSVPSIGITSPADGDVVGTNFPIIVNAFDRDGNGTVVRVEFFADGNKIGETTSAPHTFPWTNAPAGLHSLTAKASDAGGNVILSSTVTVTVSKLHQSIAFEPISNKTYGDAPFGLNASASSGLPLTFAVVSGPATVSGNSVTISGAGTVTVRASQSGDTNYNPAAVDVTFNVAKASATISLNNLNQTYNGAPKVVTATTNPAGLTGVAITYDGSATAPTNAANYSVVAALTHDNYAASNATGTLTIAKASQTITFNAPANKTYGDAPFGLSASSSSNLAVTFLVVSGPATISGSTVTITGVGTVTVRASQPGDANYNAALNADRSFTIAKGPATIALNNLNQTYNGTPRPATATTNPAGLTAVSITYNGSATAPTNAGSYAVVASLSNANYQAADSTGTLTIAKASQTITFNAPANKTYGDAPFALSATSSSNLAVTFSVASGPATISGSTVTITGAGTVTVRASQSGDGQYNAAIDVDRIFDVAKATATMTLTNLNQIYDGIPKPVTVTTVPEGLAGVVVVYGDYGNTAPADAGSYYVQAFLSNNNYTANDVTRTLVIAKASQSITFNPLPNRTYGDSSFALSASSSSSLAVALSIISGPATLSGNTLTITGAGSIVVRASQNGNFNYNAATAVDRSFTVAKAVATLTLTNLNQTYDGSPKPVTVTTTPAGLSTVWVSYDGFFTAPMNAGSYSVVASLTNSNYSAANVAGTLTISGGPSGNNYTYRRTLTIDHTKVPNTDQTNFPMLVSGTYSYLATVANGGNVQHSSGYDVVFGFDADCSMRLDHEVETYNGVTGAVNYWVRIPTLSHVNDTVIYMCYGNSSVTTSQENVTALWDANFKAVYHLKGGVSLNVVDSKNSYVISNNGATATAGQVDGGAAFNGSTQYLTVAQPADFNWSNLRTIEFWMKLGNTSQSIPRLFSQGNGSNTAWSISWVDTASVDGYGLAGKYLEISIGTLARPGPQIQKRTPDGGINSVNTWYHIAVVGDGTTIASIYVNGNPVTVLNNIGYVQNTSLSGFNIGRRHSNASYFNGSLDEIRFSNIQRTADWIKTEHSNQSSPSTFYSISSVTVGP